MALSIQGIVNRKKPRIYCLSNNQDSVWLAWMIKRGWVAKSTPLSSPKDLLTRFASSIKGMIVTDPALPPTKNIATMLAGVRDSVVATPRMAAELKLPVTEDLRGRWKTSVEAYRWAFDNLWPKLNHHVIACCYPDQMGLRDYLVENKVFIFWLSGPIDGARSYANPQKELELMEQLLAKMPVNMPVMGYPYAGKDIGIGEGPGVTLFAEFGKYLPVLTDTSNLSCSLGCSNNAAQAGTGAARFRQWIPGKVYVSFLMSDGDNLPVLSVFNYPPLWCDPLRGKLPIGWTASPSAIMLIPDIMDYYYSTSTKRDLWLGAVTGIGYTYPDSYGLRFRPQDRFKVFDGFLKQTADYMQRMDEKILWPMNLTHPDMIARYATSIPGLEALFPDYGRRVSDYQDATYSTSRNTPVFCAVTRWEENASDEEQIASLVRDVKSMAPTTRPAFLHLFIWNWGAKLSSLKEVLHRLGPDYVAVRPDQLASLYRQYMKTEKLILRMPNILVALENRPLLFTVICSERGRAATQYSAVIRVAGMAGTKLRGIGQSIAPSKSGEIQISATRLQRPDRVVSVWVDTREGQKRGSITVRRIAADETSISLLTQILNLRLCAAVLRGNAVSSDRRHRARRRSTGWIGLDGALGKGVSRGFLIYGPYEDLPAGKYVAMFRMKRTSAGEGTEVIIDTVVGGGSPTTSTRTLSESDLPVGKFRSFGQVFEHPGGSIETRLQWKGSSDLAVDSVTIFRQIVP